jgi:hypothetical protein
MPFKPLVAEAIVGKIRFRYADSGKPRRRATMDLAT